MKTKTENSCPLTYRVSGKQSLHSESVRNSFKAGVIDKKKYWLNRIKNKETFKA